jgi:hypothetical protein
MLIQVVFSDKKTGLVKRSSLNQLIDSGLIAAFRRVDNWAFIGKDSVRSGCNQYSGKERRSSLE